MGKKGSKNKKVYKIFKKYNKKKIMPTAWLKNRVCTAMYMGVKIGFKKKGIKKKKRIYVAIKGNVLKCCQMCEQRCVRICQNIQLL